LYCAGTCQEANGGPCTTLGTGKMIIILLAFLVCCYFSEECSLICAWQDLYDPQKDQSELQTFLQLASGANFTYTTLLKHERVLNVLVGQTEECPRLVWFYPKQRSLRGWLADPLSMLLTNTLMLVLVCPETLRVVESGPDGLGTHTCFVIYIRRVSVLYAML
jgi:hypothetical protein